MYYNNRVNFITPNPRSAVELLTGWTAGAGAEWMFLPNWSLKGGALYGDLGRMNVNTVNYGISPFPTALNNTIGWGHTSVNYTGV